MIKPSFPNSALLQMLFKAGECLFYVLKNKAKAALPDGAPQTNPARTTLSSRQLSDRHKAEAEISRRQWLEGRNEVKKRHSALLMWVAGSPAQSHFLTPAHRDQHHLRDRHRRCTGEPKFPSFFSKTAAPAELPCFLAWARTSLI